MDLYKLLEHQRTKNRFTRLMKRIKEQMAKELDEIISDNDIEELTVQTSKEPGRDLEV